MILQLIKATRLAQRDLGVYNLSYSQVSEALDDLMCTKKYRTLLDFDP